MCFVRPQSERKQKSRDVMEMILIKTTSNTINKQMSANAYRTHIITLYTHATLVKKR